MWFIAFCLLAVSDASLMRVKRSLVELDPTNMRIFTEQFHTTLMHIIAAEWNATEPAVKELKEDMNICHRLMNDRKTQCETCAKGECSPTVGEIIENIAQDIGIEIAGFFDDVGHGFVSWEGWDDMKYFFEGIGKNFVGWEGWRDMGDFFENIGRGFVQWSGWQDMGDFFEDIAKGFHNFGKDLGKGFTGLGKGIGDIGKGIGSGFKSTFSFMGKRSVRTRPLPHPSHPYRSLISALYPYKRRTEIDPEVRECMGKCNSCTPFLGPPDNMVSSVCGRELVELNRTVQNVVHKLEVLYNRMVVDKLPAVTTVRYDPTSMVPAQMAFTRVYLTAYLETGVEEYQSEVPYHFMNLASSAALMAREYFDHHIRH